MRYWYIDSADLITLMLIDKGYYDYDFSAEAIEKGAKRKRHKRTDKEQREVWKRMGFGNLRKPGEPRLTAEEIQQAGLDRVRGG